MNVIKMANSVNNRSTNISGQEIQRGYEDNNNSMLAKLTDILSTEYTFFKLYTVTITTWISSAILVLSTVFFISAFSTNGWGWVESADNGETIQRYIGLWEECNTATGCKHFGSVETTSAFKATQGFAVLSLTFLFSSIVITLLYIFLIKKDNAYCLLRAAVASRILGTTCLMLTFAIFASSWYKPRFVSPGYRISTSYSFGLCVTCFVFEFFGVIFICLEAYFESWYEHEDKYESNRVPYQEASNWSGYDYSFEDNNDTNRSMSGHDNDIQYHDNYGYRPEETGNSGWAPVPGEPNPTTVDQSELKRANKNDADMDRRYTSSNWQKNNPHIYDNRSTINNSTNNQERDHYQHSANPQKSQERHHYQHSVNPQNSQERHHSQHSANPQNSQERRHSQDSANPQNSQERRHSQHSANPQNSQERRHSVNPQNSQERHHYQHSANSQNRDTKTQPIPPARKRHQNEKSDMVSRYDSKNQLRNVESSHDQSGSRVNSSRPNNHDNVHRDYTKQQVARPGRRRQRDDQGF